ncbi:unnamed protein product [Rhizopus stolonifer]
MYFVHYKGWKQTWDEHSGRRLGEYHKKSTHLTIPGECTVDKILDDYKHQYPVKDDILDEFIQGIRLYFNKTLNVLLLYRNEYQQYYDTCINKSPSSVYGPEHLLRLFGKPLSFATTANKILVEIPNLMGQTSFDAETQNDLKSRLEEFLAFMHEREKMYFLNDYQSN